MRIGTSNFLSIDHARRYYLGYGYSDIENIVAAKLKAGEISIGEPELTPGQSFRWDRDGRGEITESE